MQLKKIVVSIGAGDHGHNVVERGIRTNSDIKPAKGSFIALARVQIAHTVVPPVLLYHDV